MRCKRSIEAAKGPRTLLQREGPGPSGPLPSRGGKVGARDLGLDWWWPSTLLNAKLERGLGQVSTWGHQ
eukprot:2887176-Pyramimonas_sp.AAC.1